MGKNVHGLAKGSETKVSSPSLEKQVPTANAFSGLALLGRIRRYGSYGPAAPHTSLILETAER